MIFATFFSVELIFHNFFFLSVSKAAQKLVACKYGSSSSSKLSCYRGGGGGGCIHSFRKKYFRFLDHNFRGVNNQCILLNFGNPSLTWGSKCDLDIIITSTTYITHYY